jgi:hypothetical protein
MLSEYQGSEKKLRSRKVASYSAALMLGTLVTGEDPAASLMSTMGFHITYLTLIVLNYPMIDDVNVRMIQGPATKAEKAERDRTGST